MGSQVSQPEEEANRRRETPKVDDPAVSASEEDEPDEWDKRIYSTGCADENMKMTDCYFARKDWRACAGEMEAFKQCWKRHGNDQRTATRDA